MTTPDFPELAAASGIDIDPKSIRTDASDADWFVAGASDKAGRAWTLRAPRRGDVLQAARYEQQALAFMKGRAGVVIPDWKVASDKLVAYPALPGEPAAEADPITGETLWTIPEDSGVFLNSLAIAMVRMHDISAKEAEGSGLRIADAGQARQRIRVLMDDAKAFVQVPDVLWKLWERWLYDDSFWPQTTGLIHGDLYPQHLFVAPDHELVAIDDWADAEIGDVARDFAPVFSALGRAPMEDLMLRYARAGGQGWPRMADHAEMYYWAAPLHYAAYAMRTGDLSHLMGVKGLFARYASMLEDSGL